MDVIVTISFGDMGLRMKLFPAQVTLFSICRLSIYMSVSFLSIASPSKPQNVRGEPTNTTLTVSWNLPESDGGRTDVYFNLSICLVASSTNDSQVSEKGFAGKLV